MIFEIKELTSWQAGHVFSDEVRPGYPDPLTLNAQTWPNWHYDLAVLHLWGGLHAMLLRAIWRPEDGFICRGPSCSVGPVFDLEEFIMARLNLAFPKRPEKPPDPDEGV